MQVNFPINTRKDVDSPIAPASVRHLERSKVFQYAILLAAFEVTLRTLDTVLDSDVIKSWEDLIHLPTFLALSAILFASGVKENYTAAVNPPIHVPQDPSSMDPSVILIQKVDLLTFATSKATYEAVVEAIHTLPDAISNWQDLVMAFDSLRRSLHVLASAALKNYTTFVSARNLPPSTLLDVENSRLSAIFEAFESDPDPLANVIRERLDMMNISSSVRRSFRLFNSRSHHDPSVPSTSAVFGFFPRLCEVLCHPTHLSSVFLDFCSILYSFWDGKQSGPDFILPMSSLTRRPSARLSRLLVQHSRDLPHDTLASEVSSRSSSAHLVALIDLNQASGNIDRHGYSAGADIYGLTSLLLLVMTLNLLFSPSWAIGILFLRAVVMTCGWSVLLGDGTLSLVHQSQASRTSTPAYAMLLDEDFTVLLRGTQDVVEAVTLGGFHLSYPVAGLLQPSAWNVLVDVVLQGFFQGLWFLLVILPVWQFIPSSFIPSMSHWLVSYAVINLVPLLVSLSSFPRALQTTTGNPAAIVLEFVRMGARSAPLYVAWFLYIHDYSTFQELQVLFDMLFPLALIFILSVPLPNYPVRTEKFLRVLGNPPAQKWQFKTLVAAATFQCLVLCHDIPRPVRSIDVRGVLDTVIPDQREVWQAWKARVADRVTHEEDIIFSSTLPTFRDEKRQKQLEGYLEEAQSAYQKYRGHYYATNI